METLGHIVGAVLVFGALWIATGFVSRIIVWLFCIGYGC